MSVTSEATAIRPFRIDVPEEQLAELSRRDGREVVFASNRVDPSAFGGQDLWVATRNNVRDPWSAPVNLGDAVNTTDNETRPSLSWKGTTLYFGRAPAPVGPADILVTTWEKTGG